MDFSQDDFKGFGEGFEGFPKRLPEDCVEYSLFIIDSRLKSQKELLGKLEEVRKESLKLVESLLKEYIWQRESFKLELESGKGPLSITHARVTTTKVSFRAHVPSRSYKLRRFCRGRMAYCIYPQRIKHEVSQSVDQSCRHRRRILVNRSRQCFTSLVEPRNR